MKTINEFTEKIGINHLNEMQGAVVKAIQHTNDNIMVLSPTGSGKTLAYILPLVCMIDSTSDDLQAIVIVPGRELALQSLNVLRSLGNDVRGYACYGGRPTMDEHRQLRQLKPHIIFATPGRMNDHIDKDNVDVDSVKWIIIDEFDKCLEMGFHEEMSYLINRLPFKARQILLSATPAEEMRHQTILKSNFKVMDFIPKDEQISDRVSIYQVRSPQKDKLEVLGKLLCQLGSDSTIIFLNYRDGVERTANYLKDCGFVVSYYHGGLEQKEREAAIYRFSNGSSNILVSTDLASRGLDIPNIKNIIHYHLPDTEDAFVHRVGRTARWDAMGDSYFVLGPEENIPEYVEAEIMEFSLQDNITTIPLPTMATIYIGKGKKDKISKGDIVGLLCKKAELENNEIGRIDVKDYYSYVAVPLQKLSRVLQRLAGEKIKGVKTRFEPLR